MCVCEKLLKNRHQVCAWNDIAQIRPDSVHIVRVRRSIRYVHLDQILKSDEAPKDMLSPDSPEVVVRDTPAVPPHVPPGILHVPQSAGLPSEVLASSRLTSDVRVPGPRVQSPTSTPKRGVEQRAVQQSAPTKDVQQRAPTKGVQQRAPMKGVQQRAPRKGVQQRASTKGVQTGTPMKGVQTGTPTKGVPPEPAMPQRRYPVVPTKLQDFAVGST